MPTLTEQERRKREGEAIIWSLLATADLARVDEDAVALAAALWFKLAPKAAQGLVYARSSGPELFTVKRRPTQYRWDQARLRYIRGDGRAVSPAAVKQNVNAFVDDAADELRTMTQRMNAGEIAIPEWQTGMASKVKSIHMAVDIVAQGGVAQLDDADVTRITKGIDYQLRKLLDFSRGVTEELSNVGNVDPIVRIPDKAAVTRAAMYAQTARTAYESSVHQSWADLAATGVKVEMKNVLDPYADHCHPNEKRGTPGCPEETARKWVPIGTMSLPGNRTCAMNCRCHLQYRRPSPTVNLN